MNRKISFYHFENLHKKGYTLDHIYLLSLSEKKTDIEALCENSVKLKTLYQELLRKGLISDSGKITLSGKALLEFLNSEEEVSPAIQKKSSTLSAFEKWWKAYPGTDTFKYRGTSFTGTRGLRQAKEDCKIKFDKIIDEGEYSVEDLISALEYEVLQKKENSIKTKSNKMTFMKNSITYLNQRTFEPFIELVKEGNKIVESKQVTGGTDV